jgi:glutamate-ammonia-ligase adenylyltransferase
MVRIAWRDLAGWAGVEETIRELSWLASACVDGALSLLSRWQTQEFGTPLAHGSAEPQSLVVIGMGKLGAEELNFSSDIDLIFAYPEAGTSQGGAVALDNEEYFVRLGRRLIRVLQENTRDGFVFRVDMRLRPFGDSGPLVMSFNAMEEYYQSHGREWERYAWIKADVIAGDRAAGGELMRRLRPFVYRRYLDYGAFESLREMKQGIAQQVRRKGMQDNIKLGAGGIREVEFIGQAFQLVRGGREPGLQERGILHVLAHLVTVGILPEYAGRGLIEAYRFLRRVENRLQAWADQQTHSLPTEEADRLRLALSMGYTDWAVFEQALNRHRRLVQDQFEQVFSAPQAVHAESDTQYLARLWQGELDDEQAQLILTKTGYDDAAEVVRLLNGLRTAAAYRALTPQGRDRFDRLMPLVLGAAAETERPVVTLQRVLILIEHIARRVTYLVLLIETPLALSQLVKLCAASPWIARFLARHPLSIDELIDPRRLYMPLDRAALEQDMRSAMSAVPVDDLERQMDVLRHFKQGNVLRVAAADVAGVYPLMVVSDHLTEIAEVVLAKVLELAYAHLISRHGRPQCRVEGKIIEPGFAVVGYGKLGGIELGYGSDLDLVFLHDSAGEDQMTAGPAVIDNAVFFARLGQRIIHMLNTQTPAGVLYEVDMRLRPSGAAGLLVSNIEAFQDYQLNEAWTWEHQALVRARAVAGDKTVAGRFEDIRRAVLSRSRDPVGLCKEVREMRERMRAELGRHDPAVFDLKQDRGGIADIEFMVQYGVLRWAHDHPVLLRYTDNIRLLEGFAQAGLMAPGEVALLGDAYRAYRAEVHRCTLQEQNAVVPDERFKDMRAAVGKIWAALME